MLPFFAADRWKAKSGCPFTRRALLVMNLSNEPLKALYTLLPFILYKELNATPFQVSLFIALRPVFSLFSFYWSSHLFYYKNKLLSNLVGAWILARIPFLFLPLFPSCWFLFLASAFFQLFSKAEIPAWIEIIKRKIPKKTRVHLFSVYNILTFLEGVGLSFIIGRMLDRNAANWTLLFCAGAVLGLVSVIFQRRISLSAETDQDIVLPKNRLLYPLNESINLLQSRPDFARFQWGFMLGGSALMFVAPALTIFYSDYLSLSYSSISLARFAFMGLGVTISSLLWKHGLGRIPINTLVGLVLIGFVLYSLSLFLAQINVLFFFAAFLIYGIAQAGSQLLWNLSGTFFSGDGDSFPFTNVSILMLGIRGAVAPLLGGKICVLIGPIPTLLIGTLVIVIGIFYMLRKGESSIPSFPP